MWTVENRSRYDRYHLRYPSDLTDEEWALIGSLIPPAKPSGNKRGVDMREVVDALMHVLSTGCQWRAIPKDLPPRSTVHGYFDLWNTEADPPCVVRSMPGEGRPRGQPDGRHHRLTKRQGRRKTGRWIDPSGYDAGRNIEGKKRLSSSTRKAR